MADVAPLPPIPRGHPQAVQQLYDLDAEGIVLSSSLVVSSAFDEVISMLEPEHFYSESNRSIYRALGELHATGSPIDPVTVARHLHSSGRLAQIGGTAYIAQLTESTPYVAHVADHARIVLARWRLRQALATAQQLAAMIRTAPIADDEVQALLEQAERGFAEIAHQASDEHLIAMSEALARTQAWLDEMSRSGSEITGTPMRLRPLDRAMSGLHPGDLYIVAGRPGTGKTSLALGIAESIAEQGEGVAVFSLEMPTTQLAMRQLSSRTRIPLTTFRRPARIGKHWPQILTAISEIERLPMWIDDSVGISVPEIRARVRKLKADIKAGRCGLAACRRLRLVVIDYLQLVYGKAQSREQEVALVSRSLKELAKQEDVIVMALSQLSRASEARRGSDRRPKLSDLRESGAIEQDADAVLFVYRPEMDQQDPDALQAGVAEIIIGKQRNGPTGIHRLAFSGEIVRFAELEPGEHDEYDQAGWDNDPAND